MAPTPATQAPPTPASHGFHREIGDRDFAKVVARVTEAEDRGLRLDVAFMNPVTVLQMTSHHEVARVAHEVRDRLERVRASLVRGAVDGAPR